MQDLIKFPPIFIPRETGVKPYLSQGTSCLKQGHIRGALTCYYKSGKALLNSLGEFKYDCYWTENRLIPVHDYRFVYCPIPKVGCTSWKNLILPLEGIDYNDVYDAVHDVAGYLALCNYRRREAIKII